MLVLDYSSAHDFVRNQRRMGNDVRWDGWEMVFFKKTHHGFSNNKGAFRNGRWGMETRISVDSSGLWKIPARNARTS